MIFMSQSGLTDPARQQEWDAWYVEHLRIMRTVPGISSAQRFKTSSADYPPSLAMYTIASADVFQDPYYLSVRGMGEWKPLIDARYYRRNLFDGMAVAPRVDQDQLLIVADRDEPDISLPLTWLSSVALDQSTPRRGIAIVDTRRSGEFASRGVGIYVPMME